MLLTQLAETAKPEKVEVQRLTYTLAETCSALGVSPTTMWRLERRGLLNPIPGIRHKRYAVSAIKRFVEAAG